MVPEWLSLIDIAFIAVALLFALGGLQKGFANQVAHLLTLMGMGAALLVAYPAVFTFLGRIFRNLNETYMTWILMAGVIVLTVLFFILITKILAGFLRMQISDRSDRVYGFLLGFVRGAVMTLIIMALLVILGSAKFDTVFSEKSRIGRFVCFELVPRIQPRLNKSSVGDGFDRMREALIHQEEAGVVE
jgi:uncharacterized membrane protein required for colicin V production